MSAQTTIHGIPPFVAQDDLDPRTRAREFLNRMAAMADYYDARVSKAAEATRKLRDFYEHREWTKPWHHEVDPVPAWSKPQHFELWNFETKPSECCVWSWTSQKKGVNTRGDLPRSDKKTTYFRPLDPEPIGMTPIRSRIMPDGIDKGTLDDEIEYGEMTLLGDVRPITIITESEYLGGLDDTKKSRPYEDCLEGEHFRSDCFGGLAGWIQRQDKIAEGGLHPEEQNEKTKSEVFPFVRQPERRIDEEDWGGFQIRDFTSKASPEKAKKKKSQDDLLAELMVKKVKIQKYFGMHREEKFKEDAIAYVMRMEGMTHEEAGMLLDKNADAARQQLDERRRKFLAEPSGPISLLIKMKEILWETARNDTPPGWYVLAQMPHQPYKLYPVHQDDMLEALMWAQAKQATDPEWYVFVSHLTADREAYRTAKKKIRNLGRSKVNIAETYQTVRDAFSKGYLVSPDEWNELPPRLTAPKAMVEGRCDEG